MATFQAEVNPTMQLLLRNCGGDVQITGDEATTLVIEGDVVLDEYLRHEGTLITIHDYPDDLVITLPRQAQIELEHIAGDVSVQAVADLGVQSVARLRAQAIGGDVRVNQVPELQLEAVGGDATIQGAANTVQIGRIGGDLRLGRAAQLSIKSVGGDATLDDVGRLISFGHIGGDLRATWNGNTEGETRGTIGGDVELRLPNTLDLTLSAVIGGGLKGNGTNWNMRRGPGRQRIVFGNGDARLHLTVGGDLIVKGGNEVRQTSGAGSSEHRFEGQDWEELRGSMDAFGDEMRGLGRELEEMGRNFARELSGLGRDIAREVRVAGRDTMRDAAKNYVYSNVRRSFRTPGRPNDFHFDPEQMERIKREARSAAMSGITRAQEAVERALQHLQQPGGPYQGGAPRPPQPPTPPQPPYTGQTQRIDPVPEAATPAQPSANLDAERLAILRMVHEGRLAPDEAEMLLRGLEEQKP